MLKLLVAAPQSNTGKTSVTCGLLELALRKGLNPCAFKCGPDYIDPMFHKTVLGIESHNLDIFLAGENGVKDIINKNEKDHGAAICEGVMGYYDGVGMTEEASSYQVAGCGNFKTLLVVRPKGTALSLAAVIKGMAEFREDGRIAAVFLNDCSEMMFKSIAPVIEAETKLPVVGFLPHIDGAEFKSRHLGLYTAGEIHDLKERIGLLADSMEKTVDFDKIIQIYWEETDEVKLCSESQIKNNGVVIAVAKDDAFNFIYAETIEKLQAAGAGIEYFSPLNDREVPESASAIYLPGGYPEIYADRLSENKSMLKSIKKCRNNGMPIVAECGGFLYLGKTLQGNDGAIYQMASVLEGEGVRREKLVRFGYSYLTARYDSMLFKKGEKIPVHEFHYWDSSSNGNAFTANKKHGNRNWECGFADETLYAGFPHLYFAGEINVAARFVNAAEAYRRKR